jgi:hypothetical protein
MDIVGGCDESSLYLNVLTMSSLSSQFKITAGRGTGPDPIGMISCPSRSHRASDYRKKAHEIPGMTLAHSPQSGRPLGSYPVLAEGSFLLWQEAPPHGCTWQVLRVMKRQVDWGGFRKGVTFPTARQAGPDSSAPASSLYCPQTPLCPQMEVQTHKQETEIQPSTYEAKVGIKT